MQLQKEDSQVCGQYCIMFLHYMSTYTSLDRFISIFDGRLDRNDEIVEEYYNTFMKIKPKKYNNNFVSDIITNIQSCS